MESHNKLHEPVSPKYARLKQNLKTSATIATLIASAAGAAKGVSEFADYREKQGTTAAQEAIKTAVSSNPEAYLISPLQKAKKALATELWKPAGPDFSPGLKPLKIKILKQQGKLHTVWHPTEQNELVVDPPASATTKNEEGTEITLDQFKDSAALGGTIAMNENTWIWENVSSTPFYGDSPLYCQKKDDAKKTSDESCNRRTLMVEFERDQSGKMKLKDISILLLSGKNDESTSIGRRISIKDSTNIDEKKLETEFKEALAKMQEYKALQIKSEDTQKVLAPVSQLTKSLNEDLGKPVGLDFQSKLTALKVKLLRRTGKIGDTQPQTPPFLAAEEGGTDLVFDSFEQKHGGFIAINKNMLVWKDQSGTAEPLLVEFERDHKGKIRIKDVSTLQLIDREVKNVVPSDSASQIVARRISMNEKPQIDQQKFGSAITEAQAKIAEYNLFLKGIEDIRKEEAQKSKIPDHHKNPNFALKLERGAVQIETTTAAWEKSRALCTGWIAGPNVIGTARHCVENSGHEKLLTGVSRIVANAGQQAKISPLYTPKSSRDYAIAYPPKEDNRDIAVIVLSTPIFPSSDILKVRSKPVVSGNYFSAHFAGYNFPQIWKIDQGQVRSGAYSTLNFDFSNQGGNSGGPIVDFNGDIVSLHALSTGRDSTANSEGPLVTQQLMDNLIKQAKARIAGIQK